MTTGINISIGADGRLAVRELAKVGKSVKKLGTDTTTANKRSVGSWTELHSKVQIVRQSFGALLRVVRPLVDQIRGSVEGVSLLGDEIAKTARNAAVSADALQTFQFAAGRAGASPEAVTKALQKLSQNMIDAISGSKRMVDLFGALDVEIRNADGSLRDVGAVFLDVSDVIQDMGESAESVGVEAALLGRGGKVLGNLMLQGSEGVDVMERRLDELRGRMSGDLLTASEKYRDSVLDLDVAMQGVRNELGEHLIPQADEFVGRLTNMAVGVGILVDQFEGGAGTLGLAGSLLSVVRRLSALNPLLIVNKAALDALASGAERIGSIGAGGRDGGPPPDLPVSQFFPKSRDRRREVATALSNLATPTTSSSRSIRSMPAGKAADAEVRRAEGVERQIRSMERRAKLAVADARAVISLNSLFAQQDIARRESAGELTALEASKLIILTAQSAELATQSLLKSEQEAAAAREMETLADLHRAEIEHAEEMQRLDTERAESRVETARASVEAVNSLLGAGADIADKIFQRERSSNVAAAKKAFEVRKAFAVAQAIVNTALAATNAMATAPNFIVGAALAAVAGVIGAVQIAAIAAEQPSFGDAGILPISTLRDTHRSAIIRNDEMVIDPKGTRDVSAMFEMMRRGMELNTDPRSAEIRVVNVIDGDVITDVVERRTIDRIERGDDFRNRVRA